MIAPAIWRDLRHEKMLEIRQAELRDQLDQTLFFTAGLSFNSSTNQPGAATETIQRSLDLALSETEGLRLITAPSNAHRSRQLSLVVSSEDRGIQRQCNDHKAWSRNKSTASTASHKDSQGTPGTWMAAKDCHAGGPRMEQCFVNLYGSGVFRNYLWRKGYRQPKSYSPVSHKWPDLTNQGALERTHTTEEADEAVDVALC